MPPRATLSSWQPRQMASSGRSISSATAIRPQLEGVAVRVEMRRVTPGPPAVLAWIDVVAARQHEAVEAGEQRRGFDLARHLHRRAAGRGDRVGVSRVIQVDDAAEQQLRHAAHA